MQLRVAVDGHPKNFAGIRAVLEVIGDGQIVDFEHGEGNALLRWERRGREDTVTMPIPLESLSDPSKVHEIQEAARIFSRDVLSAMSEKHD